MRRGAFEDYDELVNIDMEQEEVLKLFLSANPNCASTEPVLGA